MKRIAIILAATLVISAPISAQVTGNTVFSPPPVPPADSGWPRIVQAKTDTFTVYQPQLDSWEGNQVVAHMAVSVLPSSSRDSIFGVVEFTARTDVDKANRTVYLEAMKITSVKFPTAPDRVPGYLAQLTTKLPARSHAIQLDKLETALQVIGGTRQMTKYALANAPPAIVFSSVPAVLVPIDGPPVWRAVKGTKLTRVINTAPVVVKSSETKMIYLHVFDGWMQSADTAGPWTVTKSAPIETVNDLNYVLRALVDSGDADPLSGAPSTPYSQVPLPSLLKPPVPKVIIATTTTELIVTDSAPKWAPIAGVPLRYIKNTSGRILQDTTDGKVYILLSGRWFTSKALAGPWTYVKGADLPKAFAQIPDSSAMENVRAAIPGTPQAEEARIENSIPQTETLSRTTTKADSVEIDGPAKVLPLELTGLQYVSNASRPLIEVTPTSWYLCENGVWFTGPSMYGPWAVATTVPDAIYSIPPSSPLHYVTYVKVYDSSADSVWLGYTPGYTGVILDDENVAVYGTGYGYTPWIGNDWYAPPFTYGYGANIGWTPWYGWRYGAGYGYAWGWGGYGLGSYRGVGRWGVGDWGSMTGSVYDRWDVGGRAKLYGGVDPRMGNPWGDRFSMSFNSRTGWAVAGQYGATGNVFTGVYADGLYAAGIYGGYGAYAGGYYGYGAYGDYAARWAYRNNVYGDRNGNVFRRDGYGSWSGNGVRGWGGVDAGRAAALNRWDGGRGMGETRAGGFNNAGGARARSGGGARRGGGGRRR
jgi:hypothetical protein